MNTKPAPVVTWDDAAQPRHPVMDGSRTRWRALGVVAFAGKQYRCEVSDDGSLPSLDDVTLRHLAEPRRGALVAEKQLGNVREAALAAYIEVRKADRAKARAAFLASNAAA